MVWYCMALEWIKVIFPFFTLHRNHNWPYAMHRADTKSDIGRYLIQLVKIAKPQTRKTQPSKTNVSRRCDTTETWPRQLTKCCRGGRNPTSPGVHRLISYAGNFFIISSSSSLHSRWNSRSGVTVATCTNTRDKLLCYWVLIAQCAESATVVLFIHLPVTLIQPGVHPSTPENHKIHTETNLLTKPNV